MGAWLNYCAEPTLEKLPLSSVKWFLVSNWFWKYTSPVTWSVKVSRGVDGGQHHSGFFTSSSFRHFFSALCFLIWGGLCGSVHGQAKLTKEIRHSGFSTLTVCFHSLRRLTALLSLSPSDLLWLWSDRSLGLVFVWRARGRIRKLIMWVPLNVEGNPVSCSSHQAAEPCL